MFHSDFDPPPRTHSVRGLLGIVAAVLIGIGVTVYGYLAEASPAVRTVPGTVEDQVQERFQGEAPSLRGGPELPRQRVEPVQHRSRRRPQAAASPRPGTRDDAGRVVRTRQTAPVSETSRPAAAAPAEPAVAPAPVNQARARSGGRSVPPADV